MVQLQHPVQFIKCLYFMPVVQIGVASCAEIRVLTYIFSLRIPNDTAHLLFVSIIRNPATNCEIHHHFLNDMAKRLTNHSEDLLESLCEYVHLLILSTEVPYVRQTLKEEKTWRHQNW